MRLRRRTRRPKVGRGRRNRGRRREQSPASARPTLDRRSQRRGNALQRTRNASASTRRAASRNAEMSQAAQHAKRAEEVVHVKRAARSNRTRCSRSQVHDLLLHRQTATRACVEYQREQKAAHGRQRHDLHALGCGLWLPMKHFAETPLKSNHGLVHAKIAARVVQASRHDAPRAKHEAPQQQANLGLAPQGVLFRHASVVVVVEEGRCVVRGGVEHVLVRLTMQG